MVSGIDANVFPPHHRKNIKALIFDMEKAHEEHRRMYNSLIRVHTLDYVTSAQIDDKTFDVVEAYRVMMDTINSYTKYIKKNKLEQYYNG
jgi:mRNA-degrading endonuclease RelE of RelBE toxin-antitoxin system